MWTEYNIIASRNIRCKAYQCSQVPSGLRISGLQDFSDVAGRQGWRKSLPLSWTEVPAVVRYRSVLAEKMMEVAGR